MLFSPRPERAGLMFDFSFRRVARLIDAPDDRF